jgi:F-type H+-transporting ATPase subunit delta
MSGMTVAAKRYAKALFAVAQEKGTVEETQSQLHAVASTLEGNADIRAFFDHPNIGVNTKLNVLKDSIGGKVSDTVLNTLQLLLERGRISAVSAVSTGYKAIAEEALGRAHAQVTSAFELTTEQQEEVARQFSVLTGKQVTVETTVDSSLLGGIRVRIGDTLYDGSLSTKLAGLERSFNKAR